MAVRLVRAIVVYGRVSPEERHMKKMNFIALSKGDDIVKIHAQQGGRADLYHAQRQSLVTVVLQ